MSDSNSLSDDQSSSDSNDSMCSKSDDSTKMSKSKKHKKKSSRHKTKRKERKHEKRKGKKKKRDKEKEREKRKKKKHHKESKSKKDPESKSLGETEGVNDVGPELPPNLPDHSRNFAPMSKEQWEAKQKEVKRVFDEETGRYRLVRGTGEILEEIVSKERHKEINKQATLGDGEYFQTVLNKR